MKKSGIAYLSGALIFSLSACGHSGSSSDDGMLRDYGPVASASPRGMDREDAQRRKPYSRYGASEDTESTRPAAPARSEEPRRIALVSSYQAPEDPDEDTSFNEFFGEDSATAVAEPLAEPQPELAAPQAAPEPDPYDADVPTASEEEVGNALKAATYASLQTPEPTNEPYEYDQQPAYSEPAPYEEPATYDAPEYPQPEPAAAEVAAAVEAAHQCNEVGNPACNCNTVAPQKNFATLTVKVKKARCKVRVGGKAIGRAPFRNKRIATGRHLVTVMCKNGKYTEVIDFQAGRPERLFLRKKDLRRGGKRARPMAMR